jgi:hypothetical protein
VPFYTKYCGLVVNKRENLFWRQCTYFVAVLLRNFVRNRFRLHRFCDPKFGTKYEHMQTDGRNALLHEFISWKFAPCTHSVADCWSWQFARTKVRANSVVHGTHLATLCDVACCWNEVACAAFVYLNCLQSTKKCPIKFCRNGLHEITG